MTLSWKKISDSTCTAIFLILTLHTVNVFPLTETEGRAIATYSRFDVSLVYVFVTNRDVAWTHGDQSQPYGAPSNDVWLRAIFFPKVDDMALLTIPTSSSFYGNNTDVEVYLEIIVPEPNNVTVVRSTRKKFWSPGFVVGAWNAVIMMDQGKVTDIFWDDGCQECANERCVSNTCAVSENECVNGGVCDMKFYVAWSGKDNGGTPLISPTSLPSRFKTFALGSVYEQASGIPAGDFIF